MSLPKRYDAQESEPRWQRFWEDDPVPCGPFVPETLTGADFEGA